jgi:two-component system nitrogen regulation response regulator GlnG
VDYEECVREIISSILTDAGYRCRTFAGGLETLALLEAGVGCDLLTADLRNAPLDGLSLLRRMRESFPDIPVIMLTAVSDLSVAAACSRLGAYYLTKPFERKQLLVAVRRALYGD